MKGDYWPSNPLVWLFSFLYIVSPMVQNNMWPVVVIFWLLDWYVIKLR